ncbi:MAG: Trigger factor [uncultured bacterium (gcode 4)]|uniref:Trigger factor n=1 Tax=uncultured bacterium (gcode 4) TaxID=1234023 RepID=K2FTF3_9BACT|nr:MAG: Trigger factor [uncultured bacterium (gcode 4)]
MQSIVKRINPYTVELTIKESSKEFERCKEKVIEEISEQASIKWFRKWASIPVEIIAKNYWDDFIDNQATDKLLNEVYQKALRKETIVPTWPANIKELKSKTPFEIILEVEVLPEIEVDEKKIKKIKIKKSSVKVEASEIDQAISEIEKRFTTFEIVEWAQIELWDKVTIDTIGFDKKWWVEIPETKVNAFPLIIGSGSFIPWFEDKMIWGKVWDVVEFEITFPADYHSPDFASRKVYFMTTVFNIEKAKKPEWNEEFIEKLRWTKTDFEWFKKIIESEIFQEKEYRSRLKDEESLLEELTKISTIEIGEHLLEHEIDRIYKEQEDDIHSKWMNMWHYLEHIKKDKETYRQEIIKPEAQRRLKAELILEKLKNIIEVNIGEEEINSEIEKILSQYQNLDVLEKLRAKLIPWDSYYEDIKNRLKYKKIIDTFFE